MNAFKCIVCLLAGIIVLLSLDCEAYAQNKRLLSPEEIAEPGELPENWQRNWWGDTSGYSTEPSDRSGHIALVLKDDNFSTRRYFRQVPLTPRSEYILSYWIKTENVEGSDEDAGAGLRLGGLDFTPDRVITGTSGWEQHEVTFRTEDDDSMLLEFLLGKQGQARGTVWIDEIYLEKRSTTPLNPSVTVNLSERGPEMSEYIYGQFIEHMGNSIYGGIWAEMLQDRKFFYLPGTEKSPWHFSADDSSRLVIDSLDAYTGSYSPLLRSEKRSEITFYQENLALAKSKEYEGRILLSGSPGMSADLVLSWGEEENDRDVVTIDNLSRDYRTYEVTFTAGADTENGRLTVIPEGEGVLHIGTVSLMPAGHIDGFRPDVIALMKELNAPVYRWPGGNFVSGYNWKDGVGERDSRPPRVDRAWESDYADTPWKAVEPNDVGIHEFMRLCEILEAEPFVAVNTGLGSAKLAAEQVEYLNGSADTPMGRRRAENGHPEPFDVRFFAVGNEMYGDWQLGHMPLERYVKKHRRVSKAMWAVDPEIELVAVGSPGEWNRRMYEYNADYMTHISEHFYRQDWHGGGLMTHVKQIPEAIQEKADEHRRWRKELDVLDGRDIKIALDEWNYWYGPHIYGLLGTRYFLRDALGIAAGINGYLRNSDIIFMANYAQTVNVIGAIKATKTDAFLAATGVVLTTYRKHFGTIPVRITGDTLPFDIASALTKEGNHLTISVVNPTNEQQELQLEMTGGSVNRNGTAHVITGEHDMVYNEAGNKDAVSAREESVRIQNGKVDIPPISAVILKFRVNGK